MSPSGYNWPPEREERTEPVWSPAAPPVQPRPRQRGTRKTLAVAALALALGTAGGGVLGAAADGELFGSNSAATKPSPASVSAQPVSTTGAPVTQAGNVAGTVYNKAGGSVVEIIVSGESRGGLTPSGNGSGFVIDSRGYILTNNHVVDGARAVSVRFQNGQQREARVVGTDTGNDLALLKVDLPAQVPVATLGNSDTVAVGETAIAIGSPFGLEQTVTQGIISAVARDHSPGGGRIQRNLIQTDAPINPGNSGGPLLNARGEVVGINTLMESPNRGSVGIGFAVPINTAKSLLPRLEAGANLEPAWLGIAGMDLDATIARDQGLSVREGVLVTEAVAGGPAADAGVRGGQGQGQTIPRGGDVITAIDGNPVKNMSDLADQIARHAPGDKMQLTIVRGGKTQQLTVTLGEWPEQQRIP